MPIGVVDD